MLNSKKTGVFWKLEKTGRGSYRAPSIQIFDFDSTFDYMNVIMRNFDTVSPIFFFENSVNSCARLPKKSRKSAVREKKIFKIIAKNMKGGVGLLGHPRLFRIN